MHLNKFYHLLYYIVIICPTETLIPCNKNNLDISRLVLFVCKQRMRFFGRPARNKSAQNLMHLPGICPRSNNPGLYLFQSTSSNHFHGAGNLLDTGNTSYALFNFSCAQHSLTFLCTGFFELLAIILSVMSHFLIKFFL